MHAAVSPQFLVFHLSSSGDCRQFKWELNLFARHCGHIHQKAILCVQSSSLLHFGRRRRWLQRYFVLYCAPHASTVSQSQSILSFTNQVVVVVVVFVAITGLLPLCTAPPTILCTCRHKWTLRVGYLLFRINCSAVAANESKP